MSREQVHEFSREEIVEVLETITREVPAEDILIMGSMSAVLYSDRALPSSMRQSQDLDLSTIEPSPGLYSTPIREKFGDQSEFKQSQGYWVEDVPRIFLDGGPDGWEKRVRRVELSSGVEVKVLEPHDLAAFKLAAHRSDPKDATWIAEGIMCELLDQRVLASRVSSIDPVATTMESQMIRTKLMQLDGLLQNRGYRLNSNLLHSCLNHAQRASEAFRDL